MKHLATYRFVALGLAVLILFTSSGLSLDLHFCQNQLKSVGLFGKARQCHQMASQKHGHDAKPPCRHHANSMEMGASSDCCHNETLLLDSLGEHTISQQANAPQHFDLQFVAAFVTAYLFQTFGDIPPAYKSNLFTSPLPPKNLRVLFQTFLI